MISTNYGRTAQPREEALTVQQLIKMSKANTKPVSIRLNIDTLEFFERNATKYGVKAGRLIGTVLDDYVRKVRTKEEHDNFYLHRTLRHLIDDADKNSNKPYIHYLRENFEKEANKTESQPRDDNFVQKSIFEETTLSEDVITHDVQAYLDEFPTIAGDLEKSRDDMFVRIDKTLFIPSPEKKMEHQESADYDVFYIYHKNWLAISTLIMSFLDIREQQSGDRIDSTRFAEYVTNHYNRIESNFSKYNEEVEATNLLLKNLEKDIRKKQDELEASPENESLRKEILSLENEIRKNTTKKMLLRRNHFGYAPIGFGVARNPLYELIRTFVEYEDLSNIAESTTNLVDEEN